MKQGGDERTLVRIEVEESRVPYATDLDAVYLVPSPHLSYGSMAVWWALVVRPRCTVAEAER